MWRWHSLKHNEDRGAGQRPAFAFSRTGVAFGVAGKGLLTARPLVPLTKRELLSDCSCSRNRCWHMCVVICRDADAGIPTGCRVRVCRWGVYTWHCRQQHLHYVHRKQKYETSCERLAVCTTQSTQKLGQCLLRDRRRGFCNAWRQQAASKTEAPAQAPCGSGKTWEGGWEFRGGSYF